MSLGIERGMQERRHSSHLKFRNSRISLRHRSLKRRTRPILSLSGPGPGPLLHLLVLAMFHQEIGQEKDRKGGQEPEMGQKTEQEVDREHSGMG